MPIYDWKCPKCKLIISQYQKEIVTKAETKDCPAKGCDGKMKKQVTSHAFTPEKWRP